MKSVTFLVITAVIIAIGIIVLIVMRQPAVRQDIHELGDDLKRGARDSYDAGKDAVKDSLE